MRPRSGKQFRGRRRVPLPCTGTTGSDHVVVVAELVNGSRQVVLDVVV